ncbi:malonyl-CoA decarboxylase [Rhizobiaceae bacterium BDR2-2]|uniref:Malonyl-CoA decarboxylase n=1 Tax=Ectorhizobium quercum TaxID=2965071 RepID=A0AAE3N2F3_9HYPH|nr:malonyl-CoA decarboxylase [Ectorhizobium quercum]MCX8999568.1 malonyl-CoA decarboxylase [Ectorhizobium quercum]
MSRMAFFADLMGTLFARRPGNAAALSRVPVTELCETLLSPQGEVSGMQRAREILTQYRAMDDEGKRAFFRHLAEEFDIDPEKLIEAAALYRDNRDPASFTQLRRETEPRRQELLRRLNQAPGATEELVRMRLDLLAMMKDEPDLSRIDHDFAHLFASWFNRGFLVLRHIDWGTPANILEKIIEYEAVHAINDWNDLQRRLRPGDRRCFAFFHPAMPEEPLIFVEVALCKGVPGSIQWLLADGRETVPDSDFDTAVFYSISNCQEGLRGISFGNSLIKQVVEDLRRDLPQIRTFVTLSPVPGLTRHLRAVAGERPEVAALLEAADAKDPGALTPHLPLLKKLTADYLVNVKRPNGLPADPVARFHLGNGALLHEVHVLGDTSANGFRQSCTAMVNYLYDLPKVEENNENFVRDKTVAISKSVRSLLAQNRSSENGEAPGWLEAPQKLLGLSGSQNRS